MADWRLSVHSARPGTRVQELRVVADASQWSTGISGDGSSTEVVVVNDADEKWTPAQVESVFEPNDRLIARWWGDWCMYAQKIEDYDYNRSDGTVTVHTTDLIGEAAWRMVAGVAGGPDLVVTNRSPSGAIRAALDRMLSPTVLWNYPVDLPPDGAGSISQRWPFWKKLRMSQIIQQIEEQGGVETHWRPYGVAGGGVRFQTLVAPAVTFGATKFNLDAAETPLGDVHWRVDGKRQITGLLGLGNGTGEDQATAKASGIVNIPIRDTQQSFPDLTGAALQAATDAYYAANVDPIRQLSVGTFTISDDFPPEHAAPGRLWTVEVKGDPVIPDGIHTMRVIKVSGGNGRELSVEVQSVAA